MDLFSDMALTLVSHCEILLYQQKSTKIWDTHKIRLYVLSATVYCICYITHTHTHTHTHIYIYMCVCVCVCVCCVCVCVCVWVCKDQRKKTILQAETEDKLIDWPKWGPLRFDTLKPARPHGKEKPGHMLLNSLLYFDYNPTCLKPDSMLAECALETNLMYDP